MHDTGGGCREAHHLALALVEPLLADEAVVLVDDASWPMVARATRRFVDGRAGWSVLRTFDSPTNDDPAWANGLMVLEFRRVGPSRGLSATERVRWAFQVSVRGPANSLAWQTLQRFPGLVPLAKRVVPTGSRTVR